MRRKATNFRGSLQKSDNRRKLLKEQAAPAGMTGAAVQ
jgi:hypothetical protein